MNQVKFTYIFEWIEFNSNYLSFIKNTVKKKNATAQNNSEETFKKHGCHMNIFCQAEIWGRYFFKFKFLF